MRYWAFNANPDVFDVERALSETNEGPWLSGRSDIRRGDRAIVWKSFGSERDERRRRGIVAFAEVQSDPALTFAPSPYWRRPHESSEQRVMLRYLRSPRLPAWEGQVPAELFEGLTVRGSQGLVFRISPEKWDELISHFGGWPGDQAFDRGSSAEVADAVDAVQGIARGQGFSQRLTGDDRKAIEARAMALVGDHYRERGFSVQNVSEKRPYDLECSRGETIVRVEVKGTTTAGATVLLTPNEVQHALTFYPSTALAVVSHISLSNRGTADVTADGGILTVHEPWRPSEAELQPVGFAYLVPEGLRNTQDD